MEAILRKNQKRRIDMEPIDIQKQQDVQEQVDQKLDEKKSITSSMNIGTTKLKQADDLGGRLEYPIMRKALTIPEIKDLKKPKKEMVIRANEEVGLSMSYNFLKRSKRIKRAKTKYKLQQQLSEKQQKKLKFEGGYTDIDLVGIRQLDLSTLMYGEDKKSADENLLAHYKALKTGFSYIDDYEKSINEKKKIEGLTDYDKQSLIKDEAHLRTLVDIRTFYEVQEALMSNRYYALLPRKEMQKLSFSDLRARLFKLYEKKEGKRNNELIDYYQNLLRLKQLGITDADSVKKIEKRYADQLKDDRYVDKRDGKEEIQKIADAYKDMLSSFTRKGTFFTDEDRRTRRLMFFRTLKNDIEKFRDLGKGSDVKEMLFAYDNCKRELDDVKAGGETMKQIDANMSDDVDHLEARDKTLKGISISEDQMERMNEIRGFFMRRSWHASRSNDSLIYNMLLMPPEQQLLAFYLIENKKESGPIPADFYIAAAGYKPDLDKIRNRVNISFYKKGKTKWNIVSRAVRAASGLSAEFKEYSETTAKIESAEQGLSEADKNEAGINEKGKLIIEAISGHASLLVQFYRANGLVSDMPLDLVRDSKVRDRMYSEYMRIGELASQLQKLVENNPGFKTELSNYAKEGDSPEYEEAEKKSATRIVLDKAKKASKIYKTVKDVEDIGGSVIGLFVGAVKEFRSGNAAYGITRSSLGQLNQIMNFADMFYGLFTEGQEDTAINETTRILNSASKKIGMFDTTKGAADSVLGVLKNTKVLDGESKSMKVISKVSSGTGQVTSMLGLAVSGMKLGQVFHNEKEIKLAGKMHKERTKNREKTKDGKRFDRFLTHEKRATKLKKVSAAVSFATESAKKIGNLANFLGAPGIAGSVLKIASGAVKFIYKNTYDRSKRKSNMKATVDEFLGVDKVVDMMKSNSIWKSDNMNETRLRRNARKEALGRLGYNSYRDCFSDICGKFAEFIYGKLFLGKSSNISEWSVYSTVLRGLGMANVPYLSNYGDNPKPTVEMIKAKIMD